MKSISLICSYVAAYDKGNFDELRDARGLSGWLSTAPTPIVAQAITLPFTPTPFPQMLPPLGA